MEFSFDQVIDTQRADITGTHNRQGRNTGFYANSEESMKICTHVVEDILFNILRGNNPISRCFHDFSRFLGGKGAFSVNFFVFWPILMGFSPLWKQ